MAKSSVRICGALLVAIFCGGAVDAEPKSNWPQFRGPNGSGIGAGSGFPESWSTTRNVAWSIDIPGNGWSSPIVWDRTVFLTTALGQSAKKASKGLFGNDYVDELLEKGDTVEEATRKVYKRDIENADELAGNVRWLALAIDTETGSIRWKREIHVGKPAGGRHRKNTYASETPATDGERLYVALGNVGLFALSAEGEPLWQRTFESRKIYLDFGTGSSPVVDDRHVYVLRGNEEASSLTAFDKTDGEVRWSAEYHRGKSGSGWATPLLWKNASRAEIVAPIPGRVISYDLDGRRLWTCQGTRGIPTPMPIANSNTVFLSSGHPGEPFRPLIAVKAGLDGVIKVSAKQKSADDRPQGVRWLQAKGGTYVPTPILYDGIIYALFDKGFFAAFDAETGKQHYKVRIERGSGEFTSSPWAADGKIYCLSEDGDTFVIEAGTEFKKLSKSSLDGMCMATPAAVDSSFFIRTESKLYRVVAEESES